MTGNSFKQAAVNFFFVDPAEWLEHDMTHRRNGDRFNLCGLIDAYGGIFPHDTISICIVFPFPRSSGKEGITFTQVVRFPGISMISPTPAPSSSMVFGSILPIPRPMSLFRAADTFTFMCYTSKDMLECILELVHFLSDICLPLHGRGI